MRLIMSVIMLLMQGMSVYATEEKTDIVTVEEQQLAEEEMDEVNTEELTDEIEMCSEVEAVITPSMTQEEINAAILATTGEITVQAGNYEDKDLVVTGKTVHMLAGIEMTVFRFITLNQCTLELENNVSVNPKGIIVDSENSVMDVVDTTINGNGNSLTVNCQNSGDNKPNAYALSAKGEKVVFNNLALTVSGANGDRGLFNINSTSFEAYNSNLQVSGNAGKNQWNSAGAPNICIGHDAECATRSVLFENCVVNASGAVHPYGDGMQINKTTDPCTITFRSCDVNLDNNGGNGFMGQTSSGELTKKVVLENTNLSASGNGTGQKGACIGFANAAIELKNTDNGSYTFDVSDNYKLGIGANNLGNFTSINASGYTIQANGNGASVTDSPQPYGYGMYLTRDGSSFENCTIITENNQKDGITVGGNNTVVFKDSSVYTVLNGSNGLVMDTDAVFDGSDILSGCNGEIKGDEVDTTVNKTVAFKNATTGSVGVFVMNGSGTSDESSRIIAKYYGDSTAVTAGDTIYLLKEDGTVEESKEGDLCHHVIDWEKGVIQKLPTDSEYGSYKAPCLVCDNDLEYEPLVRVVYDKNTDDTVTNMPEEITALRYSLNIPVDGNPVREGYKFTGWYVDADTKEKTGGILDGKTPTVILYAGWEKLPTQDKTEETKNESTKTESKKPKTGNQTNMLLWLTAMDVSLLIVTVALIFGKKKMNHR